MNFLFVYYTHKSGGFNRRLYRAMNALAERGHKVRYVTLDAPDVGVLDLRIEISRPGFLLSRRSGALFWVLFGLMLPFALLNEARRAKAERLVAFGPFYAAMLAPARFLRGIPLLLCIRSKLGFSGGAIAGKLLYQIVDWIGLRCASRVVVQNAAQKSQVLGFGRDEANVVMLPNDVPLEFRSPTPRLPLGRVGTLSAVSLGAFTESKNLLFLYDVFAELSKSGTSPWVLRIVGRGAGLEALKARLNESPLEALSIEPWSSDSKRVLLESDLLLHPSRHEGMPNVVLEAIGLGVPVLCADTPELRELVEDPRLLFAPENPAELAERLRKLSLNSEALRDLGLVVHKRSLEFCFNWDERFEQICLDLR